MDEGEIQVCVPQTCCFLFISVCVCVCVRSRGLWKLIPVSYWCVFYVTRPSARMANGFSSPRCLIRPDNRERHRAMGKHHLCHSLFIFDLTRWCNADRQDRRECKSHCVCVCVRRYACEGERECVCAYMLVWVINASIIHCFKHVLRTSLRFLWRQVMFLMLLFWRVYMYICVVNKYFLFK